jgi:hypothetical protein
VRCVIKDCFDKEVAAKVDDSENEGEEKEQGERRFNHGSSAVRR